MSKNVQVLCYWMNEYHSSGRQGTNPRRFVQSYMPRPDATEVLLLHNAHERVQQLIQQKAGLMETPQQISKQVGKVYGLNWRGFTRNNDSCSGLEVHHIGNRMLTLFNTGHTIRKIMVSFRTPYLRKMRAVDSGFVMTHNGSAFGEIDQLKMRDAMRVSLYETALHYRYRDPLFLGALQLDRTHAHFHIILADNCPVNRSRRLIKASEQHSDYSRRHVEEKGKMSKNEKMVLRDNFNDQLELVSDYPAMHYQPALYQHSHNYEIRMIASKDLRSNIYLQELVASLPEDKSQWYYGNHNFVMKRPNSLMQDYIQSLSIHHGKQIGYNHALNVMYLQSRKYANSKFPFGTLYHNGHLRLSMILSNLVYKQLRQSFSQKNEHVDTPYLNVESENLPELQSQVVRMYHHQPVQYPHLIMTAYRKRSYEHRYYYHHRMRNHYRNVLRKMDLANVDGNVDPAAINTIRHYYHTNKRYHSLCMDKYRYLLGFTPNSQDFVKQLYNSRHQLMQRYQLVHQMQHRTVYDRNGESHIIIPTSLHHIYNQYVLDVSDFSDRAYDAGLIDTNHIIDVQRGYEHPFVRPPQLHQENAITAKDFQTVKGIDIDDCSLDLTPGSSRTVSNNTSDEYAQSVRHRYHAAKMAKQYILSRLQNQPLKIRQNIDRLLHLVELKKKQKQAQQLKKTHQLFILITMHNRRRSNAERKHTATLDMNMAHHYLTNHLNTLHKADHQYSEDIQKQPQILQSQPQFHNEDEIEF